jgi:DUF971 family protein
LAIPRKVSLGESRITIDWSDGHTSVHANGRLRESCPCAMCMGEPAAFGAGREIPLIVAAPPGVLATRYQMVGRYAISFVWSDGHRTGIYPYEYLMEMCECKECSAKTAGRDASRGGLISGGH